MKLGNKSRISFGLSVMLATSVACVLMIEAWPTSGFMPAFFLFLGTAAICVSYVYIRDGGFFQPMFFVICSLLFGTILKLIYIVVEDNNVFVNFGLLLGQDLPVLDGGILLISIGMIAISIGYLILGKSPSVPKRYIEITLTNQMTSLLSIGLLVIALMSLFIYLAENEFSFLNISGKRFFQNQGDDPSARFSDSGYYLFKLALLAKTSLYIFLVQSIAIKKKKKYRAYILLLLSFFCVAFVSLYFSNRIVIITLVADILVITFLFVQKVNKKLLFSAMFIGLAIFITASNLRSDLGSTKTVADHLFAGRYLLDVSKTSHFYDYFDVNGNTLLNYFTSNDSENLFYIYVNLGRAAGITIFGLYASGVPLGFVVEMFSLAGFVGVFIGMFLLGVILRWLARAVTQSHSKDYMLLIYGLLTTRLTLFLFNGGVGSTFYQMILDLTPLIFVIILTKLFQSVNKRSVGFDSSLHPPEGSYSTEGQLKFPERTGSA